MQTLLIDQNNNLILERNNMQVTDGIDACAQDTRTRVGIVRGENPFDTAQGADYFNELLGKMGGQDYLREAIRERIADNDEIVQINNLQVETDNDTTKVVSEISSIYGVFSL